jgi:outer membrane protein assembly factor BamB
MKTRRLAFVILGLGLSCFAANAADWAQWRGPNRDGISQEKGLSREWPKEGPKLLWQQKDIGDGYSTPAVVGSRIYLLSSRGTDDEFVQALSVENGKQIWSTRIGKVGKPDQKPPFPMARSTPTVEGEVLYALGSDGDLACLETDGGKVLWKKHLAEDFAGKAGIWAYSESPLIDGDALVCTPGGSEATLVALDKKTGEAIWKSAVPGGDEAAYASIGIVQAAGHKQYVQFLQKGVVGVDAKTGRFLWRYDATGKGPANIPTPVVRDDCIYSSAPQISAGGGGAVIRLTAEGDGVAAKQVYFERGLPNCIGGAVLVGDHLYGTTTKDLVCAEFATGKVLWREKCIGTGAVCFADGCLYIHGENGDAALVEATPEGYREKGRFSPSDQPKHLHGPMEKAWPYPVVANGRLYLRDQGSLWCYDVSQAKDAK